MSEWDDTATMPTEGYYPDAGPAAGTGRRPWLVLAILGGLLVAGGLVAFGVFLGWRAAAHAPVVEPDPAVVTIAADPYAGKSAAVQMPDVRGLSKQEALTALSDAGIPGRLITVTTVPWAGTPDVVVDQAPLFGTSDPAAVTIRIASRAVIPAVVGKGEDTAMNAIESLGARVQVTRHYVPGTRAGIVLGISPKPGSRVPDVVSLVISEDPGAIFLSQVQALDGSCGGGNQVTVNGVDHSNTTMCSAGSVEYPSTTTYSLRRGVQSVKGVIGIPDDADPAARAKVTITVDGRPATTVVVGYGKPVTVSLRTAGVLRLGFTFVSLNPDVSSSVALADVVLSGDPAFIAKLGQPTP